MSRAVEIFVDGASKGNPGPAGIGVVVRRGTKTLKQVAAYIGETTNNVAEYSALIRGLQEAARLKADTVTINSDSQLLCRQLERTYKVKNQSLGGLFIQAHNLITGFRKVIVNNIPREENQDADRLATEAVRKHLKRNRSVHSGHPEGGRPSPKASGRKVRAPEDSALCNTEVPDAQVRFDF